MVKKQEKSSKTSQSVTKLVELEEKRLIKFLQAKSMDKDKLSIASDIIKDVAYMTVKTIQLKEEIETNGITEEYQNGENQKGRKKSASFDAYMAMTKQKSALIKQLTDLLPEQTMEILAPVADEFDTFVNSRRTK